MPIFFLVSQGPYQINPIIRWNVEKFEILVTNLLLNHSGDTFLYGLTGNYLLVGHVSGVPVNSVVLLVIPARSRDQLGELKNITYAFIILKDYHIKEFLYIMIDRVYAVSIQITMFLLNRPDHHEPQGPV